MNTPAARGSPSMMAKLQQAEHDIVEAGPQQRHDEAIAVAREANRLSDIANKKSDRALFVAWAAVVVAVLAALLAAVLQYYFR